MSLFPTHTKVQNSFEPNPTRLEQVKSLLFYDDDDEKDNNVSLKVYNTG
jgi:hypothetical protein